MAKNSLATTVRGSVLKHSHESKKFEWFTRCFFRNDKVQYLEFPAWEKLLFHNENLVKKLLWGMKKDCLNKIMKGLPGRSDLFSKDKENIINFILDHCFLVVPTRFRKRRNEINSIERLNPENASVTMFEWDVPFHIVLLILSFVPEKRTLSEFGTVSYSCYINFLCSHESLKLTKSNLFKVPVLTLRNCKRISVRARRFVRPDFQYMLENLHRCETISISNLTRNSSKLFLKSMPKGMRVREMNMEGACPCDLAHLKNRMDSLRILSLRPKRYNVCESQWDPLSLNPVRATLAGIERLHLCSTMKCFYRVKPDSMKKLKLLCVEIWGLEPPMVSKLKKGIELTILSEYSYQQDILVKRIKDRALALGITVRKCDSKADGLNMKNVRRK